MKLTNYLLWCVVAGSIALTPVTSLLAYSITNVPVTLSGGFVLSPGKAEVFLNPGETVTRSVIVTNRSGRDLDFTLTTENFVGSDDPQTPVVLLGDDDSPFGLSDFIKPEIDKFTLKYGEQITIPVTISVPANAEPRGYYGAVIVSNIPTQEAGAGPIQPVQVVSRIGSLFLVQVNGDVKREGKLTDFRFAGPQQLAYQQSPAAFEVLFENTGNVHLVPHGIIRVKNMFGSVIDNVPVDAYFALPDAIRYRTVQWSNDRFLIGRYTATLEFYPGFGEATEFRTFAFWVLPWKILALIFVVILILVSLMVFIFSRFEIKRKS
jgi:hypothetical protein